MKWYTRITLTIAASLTLAFGLSLLPEFQKPADQDVIESSGHDQAQFAFNDMNLVDSLSGLKLEQSIRRVSWYHGILAIDLTAGAEGSSAHSIYGDLLQVCRFAFERTTNIKEVLIRVLQPQNNGQTAESVTGYMLLSMDATRDKWETAKTMADGNMDAIFQTNPQTYFGFTYTEEWNRAFAY